MASKGKSAYQRDGDGDEFITNTKVALIMRTLIRDVHPRYIGVGDETDDVAGLRTEEYDDMLRELTEALLQMANERKWYIGYQVVSKHVKTMIEDSKREKIMMEAERLFHMDQSDIAETRAEVSERQKEQMEDERVARMDQMSIDQYEVQDSHQQLCDTQDVCAGLQLRVEVLESERLDTAKEHAEVVTSLQHAIATLTQETQQYKAREVKAGLDLQQAFKDVQDAATDGNNARSRAYQAIEAKERSDRRADQATRERDATLTQGLDASKTIATEMAASHSKMLQQANEKNEALQAQYTTSRASLQKVCCRVVHLTYTSRYYENMVGLWEKRHAILNHLPFPLEGDKLAERPLKRQRTVEAAAHPS